MERGLSGGPQHEVPDGPLCWTRTVLRMQRTETLVTRGSEEVPPLSLKTLLPIEERLFEAEYFGGRLRFLATPEFGYELNAFVSAARNVTFILQKEMNRVPGFQTWWSGCQERMRQDDAMKFFKELRNRSQKKGGIRLVGGPRRLADDRLLWSYRFIQNESAVPESLAHRDVVDCCFEHLAKIATCVLEFDKKFHYHSCYRHAISEEGLEALGIDVPDVLGFIGYGHIARVPSGLSRDKELEVLRRQVDGVDFQGIERLAAYRPIKGMDCGTPSDALSEALLHGLVERLGGLQE